MSMTPLIRTLVPRSRPPGVLGNAIATLGGAFLVLLGVALPWLTLFAGLQTYTGFAGRNGHLVFAGGIAAALCALVMLARPLPALGLLTAALGATLMGFSAWLLVGVMTLARREASNPMVLAHPGPGLFVVAGGALVIALAPLLTARRDMDGVAPPIKNRR